MCAMNVCFYVRGCLCVAAMLLNPDTHAKDCCAVTGMGSDAM